MVDLTIQILNRKWSSYASLKVNKIEFKFALDLKIGESKVNDLTHSSLNLTATAMRFIFYRKLISNGS